MKTSSAALVRPKYTIIGMLQTGQRPPGCCYPVRDAAQRFLRVFTYSFTKAGHDRRPLSQVTCSPCCNHTEVLTCSFSFGQHCFKPNPTVALSCSPAPLSLPCVAVHCHCRPPQTYHLHGTHHAVVKHSRESCAVEQQGRCATSPSRDYCGNGSAKCSAMCSVQQHDVPQLLPAVLCKQHRRNFYLDALLPAQPNTVNAHPPCAIGCHCRASL
jgi:hypothetical protein